MNKNYDQVVDMFLQGNLSWERDAISALLYSNLTFVSTDQTVSDLTGYRMASQRIDGKYVLDGSAYGMPVAFQKVAAGVEYQIVLVRDIGDGSPRVLAFIDANTDDSPITLQNAGTLIIRPVMPVEPIADAPPTIGVWMRLAA